MTHPPDDDLTGRYLLDPDDNRRGLITGAGPEGDPRWWVQWFGPHRDPTYQSLVTIGERWRFYADRVEWLNATNHLEPANLRDRISAPMSNRSTKPNVRE